MLLECVDPVCTCRGCQFSRCSRRGRPQIGNKVGNREIGLVTDTDDDGQSERPAPPGGRGLGPTPGTTPIPVLETSPRVPVPRGARRKVHKFHKANGSDWQSLFLKSDVAIKRLMADLSRVRKREALKDADLARLRADRLLLGERLAAKTQAHVTVSVAFNDLVQHIQTGQLNIGTILGIASRAGVATVPATETAHDQ